MAIDDNKNKNKKGPRPRISENLGQKPPGGVDYGRDGKWRDSQGRVIGRASSEDRGYRPANKPRNRGGINTNLSALARARLRRRYG